MTHLPTLSRIENDTDTRFVELGYMIPYLLYREQKRWYRTSTKREVHPSEEIEVVQDKPSEVRKCINVDEPLIAFANGQFGRQIELNIADNSSNEYSMQIDSLKDSRVLEIAFHRTVRMPDDDKLCQLLGSLGAFPLFNVRAYAEVLPDKIVGQGGVFLAMWQREALWMSFNAPYDKNYALRVFVGRINAVSGLEMDELTGRLNVLKPCKIMWSSPVRNGWMESAWRLESCDNLSRCRVSST
jgi:hypothetical protein